MALVGIDLGTTNSLAAAFVDGRSVLVPNRFGEYLTPSVVSLNSIGEVVVGKTARERLITHPDVSAALFKRSMGTAERVKLGDRAFLPEELASFVLRQLVCDAEAFLGEAVDEAVVSVPAYFDVAQRAATKRAGALAGVKVERLVNEPSAAALGCHAMGEDETFIVFDFGGGTLDVSVVECFDNVVSVSAVSGDNHLGGSDFDEIIAREMCRCNGVAFDALPPAERESLLRAAETAKRQVSETGEGFVRGFCPQLPQPLLVTNERLFEWSRVLFDRMEKPIKQAVYDSDIPSGEITSVVLVGGSCRMPVVQRYLQELLAVPVMNLNECDTAVAKGLGAYAGIKKRDGAVQSLVLTDICPFSLSTEVSNPDPPYHALASVIIPRNTTLPVSRSYDYSATKMSRQDRSWVVRSLLGERTIDLSVYQGENLYAKDNVKLAELPVKVPCNTEANEPFTVTFTYDINAILAVEVRVHSTGKTVHFVYDGSSWAESPRSMALLEDVKLAVALDTMQVEVDFTLERAHRIAAESNENDRGYLLMMLAQYERAAHSNSMKEVVEATRRFNEVLDAMEASRNDGTIFRS